jgi:hypothetical protein
MSRNITFSNISQLIQLTFVSGVDIFLLRLLEGKAMGNKHMDA